MTRGTARIGLVALSYVLLPFAAVASLVLVAGIAAHHLMRPNR